MKNQPITFDFSTTLWYNLRLWINNSTGFSAFTLHFISFTESAFASLPFGVAKPLDKVSGRQDNLFERGRERVKHVRSHQNRRQTISSQSRRFIGSGKVRR